METRPLTDFIIKHQCANNLTIKSPLDPQHKITSALDLANSCNAFEVACFRLKNNPYATISTRDPLHKIVEHILDPNGKTVKTGNLPHRIAGLNIRPSVAQKALTALTNIGVDIVGARDFLGCTPLFYAYNSPTARYLLNRGANPNTKNKHGDTPLHYAAMWGKYELTLLLITHDARPDEKNRLGQTPSYYACQNGNFYIESLLNLINALYAARDGKMEFRKFATEYLPIGDNSSMVRTVLPFMARTPFVEQLEKYMALENPDWFGRTTLHNACIIGQLDKVKKLLKAGANIEWKDSNYNSPLLNAAASNQEAVVRYLLEQGAEFNTKNDNDRSILLGNACTKKTIKELLLASDANPRPDIATWPRTYQLVAHALQKIEQGKIYLKPKYSKTARAIVHLIVSPAPAHIFYAWLLQKGLLGQDDLWSRDLMFMYYSLMKNSRNIKKKLAWLACLDPDLVNNMTHKTQFKKLVNDELDRPNNTRCKINYARNIFFRNLKKNSYPHDLKIYFQQ